MPMTKEQLLIPRVMCVGTPGKPLWPGSPWNGDDVITFNIHDTGNICRVHPDLVDVSYFEKFPHLFSPMPWWEGRDKTDLPKYVKNIKSGRVFKAVWDCFKFKGKKEWSLILQQNGIPISPDKFLPATEQEYIDYQKQKEG